MNNKLAVVILNYNDFKVTEKLVDIIQEFKDIDHIIIVDNNSTDSSYEHLKSKYPEHVVIQTEKNGGYSYGNNVGIRYAYNILKCDNICIANPDVIFDDEVIHYIKEILDQAEYALIAPIMKNADGRVSNRPYWDLPSYIDDLLMCFTVGRRVLDRRIRKIDYTNEIMNVEVLPGSFLAFRAQPLIDVGLFDEGVFLYCEERIISKRLLLAGYKIGLLTRYSYYHMHSTTTSKFIKKKKMNILMAESRYYYECKYNNIGAIKKLVLKVAMTISNCEFLLIGLLRGGDKI